ncbi:MAG: hypothetical protein ACLPX9_20645 [Rhodomicrobium sp.]
MTVHYNKLLRTGVKVSALVLMAASLGAWDLECSSCGDRTEFVTRGVGDAIDVNKATQTIDPWPPYVKNRKLNMSGQRAGLAMDRYQANRVLRPRPLNPEKAAEAPQPDNALQAPTPQQQ